MTMIYSARQPVYTSFGEINRPTEKQIFMILHLQELLNNDCDIDNEELKILEFQNYLLINNIYDIYKMCSCFNFTKRRMENKLKKINYKLLIEFLRGNE